MPVTVVGLEKAPVGPTNGGSVIFADAVGLDPLLDDTQHRVLEQFFSSDRATAPGSDIVALNGVENSPSHDLWEIIYLRTHYAERFSQSVTAMREAIDSVEAADNSAPVVGSIERHMPSDERTNADAVVWRVTFNEDVQGVDAADFAIAGTTASLTVTASGGTSRSVYDVSAMGGNLGNLNGTVTLSLASGQDIKDLAGSPLDTTSTPSPNESTFIMDNTVPAVVVGSIVRQSPMSEITNADSVTWRVTFSKGVRNVDATDFTITGTTAVPDVAAVGTAGTTYDVRASGGDLPGLNGTVTLSFASGQDITDLASTVVTGTNQNHYTVDNRAPTVVSIMRLIPSTEITNADSVTWRVTFGEDVQGVDAADFAIAGTTASLTVTASGGTSRSVHDVSAMGGDLGNLDGTVTLSLAIGNITDLAGNPLDTTSIPSPNEGTFVIDNMVPVVGSIGRQSPMSEITNADSVTWRVAFSKGVRNVDATDFTITGTTAVPDVTAVGDSRTTYDVRASGGDLPGLDGTVALSFASGQDITDLAGNPLDTISIPSSNESTFVIDNTALVAVVGSIMRQSPTSEITNADSVTWRVTFSKGVQNVDAADFTITGTTAVPDVAAVGNSGTTYDVRASGGDLPGLNGTVTLSFASGQDITDLASTVVTGTNQNHYTVDNTVPTVASIVRLIPSTEITNADSVTWRVTFGEDVQGVDAADFAIAGTTASLTVTASGGTSRSVHDVSAMGGDLGNLDGTVTLSLAISNITDLAGNPLDTTSIPFPNESTFVIDNMVPAPVVASIVRQSPMSEITNTDSVTWRVTFSKGVRNVDATDFTIAGTTARPDVAAVGNSRMTYDVRASGGDLPGLNGTVTLSFASVKDIRDLAGNALDGTTIPSTNENTFVVDNTVPTVASIVRQSPMSEITNADSVTWRVTFSEDVKGVDAADFAIAGTTARPDVAAVGNSRMTYDVRASGGDLPGLNGTATLSFAEGRTITDLAGSALDGTTVPSSNENTFVVDNTLPVVASIVRQSPMSEITNADSITWRVTFSEDVKGIDAADFAIAGTTARPDVAAVGNSRMTYDVRASGGDLPGLNGTATLSFAEGRTITDLAGSALDGTTVPSSNENTFVVDNTVPTVSLIVRHIPTDEHTNADTLTWRVLFSEVVQNLDATDFAVTGTTAELTVDEVGTTGSFYNVNASGGDLPGLNGTATLSFAEGRTITDLAGNALNGTTVPSSNENTFVVDNAVPTVASIVRHVPSGEHTNADTLTWRVTFSEAVRGVDAADFAIAGTTAELTVAAEGSSRTVLDVRASGGDLANTTGTVTLSLADRRNITDLAGNALDGTTNPSPNQNTFVVDNTVPAVSLIVRHIPKDEHTNADTLTWRVLFSEVVQNLDATDFTITGTTAELTVNEVGATGSFYNVNASGGDLTDLDGTVMLSFAEGRTITDLAGNALDGTAGPSSNENTFLVDNAVPTVASIVRHVPSGELTNADTLTWRVTFSEAVRGVDAADFAIAGTTASLSVAAEGSSRTVHVVRASGGDLASTTGTVTLSLADRRNITDLAGNALDGTTNPSPNQNTFLVDNSLPMVASILRHMPADERTSADTLVWRVTFSEAVRNVDAADFAITGTTASLSVTAEGSSRTVHDVRASGGDLAGTTGTVTLSLASRRNITDLVGNALNGTTNPSPNQNTFLVDNTLPTVASIVRHVPSGELTNADTLIWRVTFSEAVRNVDATDFAITGTTASLSVAAAGSSRTVHDVRASGGDLAGTTGTVTLSLASRQNITDLAGNALDGTTNPSPNQNTFLVDNSLPMVTAILRHMPADERTSADTLVWRVTFSEAVRNVDAADFAITGTSAELTVAAEGSSRTVHDVRASGGDLAGTTGTVTLSLASRRNITDLVGNALNGSVVPSTNENTFLVDNTLPTVASILRQSPMNDITNADTLTWRVTFSEAVRNVDAADFAITGTSAELTVAAEGSSRTVHDVRASGGDLAGTTGTVTLSLADRRNITDLAGNALDRTTNPSPNQNTFLVDNTLPTVASILRHMPADERTSADTLVWRVTFSEAVRNVDAADFAITGTTAELTVTAEGSSRTVHDVRASGGDLAGTTGTVTLSLASRRNITDLVGNALNGSVVPSTNENTFLVDNTLPTVASILRQSPMNDITNADTLTWRVTFSEAVRNVDAADFAITGTSAELTVAAEGSSRTVHDVRASGGDLAGTTGTVTLSLASRRNITDLVGNALNGSVVPSTNENTFLVDNTLPTVASILRHVPSEERTNADTLTWRVTFNEAVRNVDAADFAITGTTAELTVTAEGSSRTVHDVRASGGDLAGTTGMVALSLASRRNITDLAGNALDGTTNPSPNQNTFLVDNTTLAVSSIVRRSPMSEITNADSVAWRVTFSEAVRNVDATDFAITGTTASLTVTAEGSSRMLYDVRAAGGDLAGTTGTVTLSLAVRQNITDLVGNALDDTTVPFPNENIFVVDNTIPMVASIVRHMPADERTSADTLTWRVTFSETVRNIDPSDFMIEGTTASLTVAVEGTSRTLYDVRAAGGDLADLDSTVVLSFAEGGNITDLAGNALDDTTNPSSDENTFLVDNSLPTIASILRHMPADERTSADTLIWRVTFSEAVRNVDAADFAITGTTASLTVAAAGTSRTLYDVRAAGGDLADLDSTVMLSFAEGRNITDLAGNALDDTTNPSSDENTFLVDNSLPTIASILRHMPADERTSADTLTWRVTFSEAVRNVDAADFAITGTTASLTVTPEGTSRTVHVVRASGGDLAGTTGTVTLSLAGRRNITDLAGNALDGTTNPSSDENIFLVDNSLPTIASILRHMPADERTSADTLTWRVTFSEAVRNVDAADFAITGTTASLTVAAEGTSRTVHVVRASGGDLAGTTGTVTLSLAGRRNITDLAGNALDDTTVPFPDENTFLVDNSREGGTISVALDENGMVVITYSGTLHSSDEVNGPYTPVAGASSPHTVAPNRVARFYASR